jgi:hypothetical protein
LVLQARTHRVPLQVTVPLAGAVQTAQEFPHEFRSVLPLTTHLSSQA